jgi:hypothetical protein
MKKTLFTALALFMLVGVAVILPLSSAHALESFASESELRQYNPAKSYGGYVLPSHSPGQTSYLLDMYGNVCHIWDNVGSTPQLQEDGTLWSLGQIQDWDGNVIWKYSGGGHHDFRKVWNKKLKQYTWIIVTSRTDTKAAAIAAGADPNWDYSSTAGAKGATGRLTGHDGLIEVNMNQEIVWQWWFLDHTVQSKNPAWPNYVKDVALAPGRFDIQWFTDMQQPEGVAGMCNDWMHVNSMDYNEDLDQVVVNAKHWSTYFVIDHGKTFVSTTDWAANIAAAAGPAGDVIYRFGSAAAYNQGEAPGWQTSGKNQLFGSHNIQWIWPYHWKRPHSEAGDKWPDPAAGYNASALALPGAGHFLIFDNRVFSPTLTAGGSKVIEINPYLNAAGVDTGAYVNFPVAGYTKSSAPGTNGLSVDYISKQVVWSYKSKNPNSCFSPHISGAQRLPNGNTSINSGTQGHLFEVTSAGEVVWEYQWPGLAGSRAQTTVTDNQLNNMFRHYRYGVNFPGLAGRDLTPIGTITGKLPQVVGSGITYPQPVTYYGFGFGAGGATVGGGGVGAGAAGGGGGGGY